MANSTNTHGIKIGSTDHRLLLAMRAQDTPASARDLQRWAPAIKPSTVDFALSRLVEKNLAIRTQALIGAGDGSRGNFSLTEQGEALVHPKTGPLCRRKLTGERA